MSNPQTIPPRRYNTPCRSCGDYRVTLVAVMAMEPGLEMVLGTCTACDSLRCRYKRKARKAVGKS